MKISNNLPTATADEPAELEECAGEEEFKIEHI